MEAFVPNDYRKRVLADVERRGGIEFSDPFELYDIPLDEAETLSDAEVSARVEEVWGFWQKQRDHPKYRVLVGLLVDGHDRRSELLLYSGSRRAEALRVRNEREQRDAERFEMLDTAISRLVQRYGGVPAGKVAGLEEIGAMGGLTAAEVAARLHRHRVIEDQAPATPTVLTDQRRKQIRQLLSEWERLLEGPPTPTLFALLQLDPAQSTQTNEIRLRADALRARARELPPGRVRVVLDELLVHVQDLLEAGPAVAAEYVRTITEDVAAELRPKIRAAVLVEDQLVGEDYEFLLEEAIELGLDRAEAIRLLAEIAGALGARIESGAPAARSASAPPPVSHARASGSRTAHRASSAGSSREWEEPLKAARAALRSGRPQEAARHVAEARQLDAGANGGATPIRPVADEVERVLAEAANHWRDATAACAAKRFVAATEHLEYLQRNASDVPPPTGQTTTLDQLLTQARAAIATADRLVAEANSAPPHDRTRALLAAQSACADHPDAAAALAATPIEAPASVHASRLTTGSVLVTWTPSPTGNADYKVTRLQPDGTWRTVGRTRTTELEDGGAPPTGQPIYAVVAAVAGRYSDLTRSDAPPPAPTPNVDASRPAPVPQPEQPVQETHPGSTNRQESSSEPVGTTQDVPASQRAQFPPLVGRVDSEQPAPEADSATSSQSGTSPQSAAEPVALPDEPTPSGIPTVSNLAIHDGRLTFDWPTGVTEVMVVARPGTPPVTPTDPQATSWKVTNTRYEIDGGVLIQPTLTPCHLAVASCRRQPNGALTIASGFASTARLHWAT
ncbi:Ig-like domain repeat protein [Nocardia sp. XZ_19_385]|uniref:Ig-like domain repeat protein n=1 Tax=Nocardia sp. XZ_19_385 TaxID=2769488 RepID=UPI00188F8503|nr:Ig-like domain repeat protein [Nocardia sp. XZ_19_385]